MPKYVRREPLLDRVKAYLNPFDFLLWLSEELDGWDQLEKEWAVPIGVAANLAFLVARANSKNTNRSYDDVFGETRGAGWTSMVVGTVSSSINNGLTCCAVLFRRSFLDSIVFSQRCLHLLAKEAVPASSKPLSTQFQALLQHTEFE